MLGLLLEKVGGHAVLLAYHGREALEVAQRERPDVILLDIGLPQMNGHEVARRLRQMPELNETLLVALTGYGTEQDRRQSQQAGFDLHLVKPIENDALQQIFAHPKLQTGNRS